MPDLLDLRGYPLMRIMLVAALFHAYLTIELLLLVFLALKFITIVDSSLLSTVTLRHL